MNSLPLPENPDAPDSAAAASRPALHPNTIAFGVLSVALILLAGTSHCFYPIEDPDLFWHIVIGRWILDHGAVPQVEYWNYFGLGQTFRAYSRPLWR